ncbi:MAG: hypothetical protein P8R42_17515 [Candidatus Binatia bacterium]|nr:hypothetical protein [Candidatus Binatia bacterium]
MRREHELLNEGLVVARRIGDSRIEAGVFCMLADRELFLGNLGRAREHCEHVMTFVDHDPQHMYEVD